MTADRFTHSRRSAESRGRSSESLAAILLQLKLYRILGRRVRTHAGEIDLVARSPTGILCFIEVKARADDRTAMESVGSRQRARIERAASLYVAGKPDLARKGIRFDIVTVAPFPRHIPDAWRP
jgi:putative endonuclease